VKIAFADLEGDLFPAVWRVAQEGHQVRYWLKDQDEAIQKIGRGMVAKVEAVDDLVGWRPDVVVAYQTPQATHAAKRAGIAAWGATPDSLALESDRIEAAKIAGKYGVGVVPLTKRFGTVRAALAFSDAHPDERWVVKADGGPKAETSTTHVTTDGEHLRQVLAYEAGRGADTFILQARVSGVEVSTEGWFDYRRGWLRPVNSTLERKHQQEGDLGPMVGCAGSIVWTWPDAEPRLWKETLKGLTPWLEEVKYIGPIDVNAILDYETHRPHFLEFTPRLGWSAFNALMAGITGNPGEFFVALGHGEADRLPDFRHPFMGSVMVSIPDAADVPLTAPYHAVRHIQPKNVWLDKGVLRSTGAGAESGFIGVFEATDAGSTVDEVRSRIYGREIPRISAASELAYRRDIGERASMDLLALEAWGYQVYPSEDLKPVGRDRRGVPMPMAVSA